GPTPGRAPDPHEPAGATGRVQMPRPKPKPPPEPEVEVEAYKPVMADDYAGDVKAQPDGPRWKVWMRRAIWTGVTLAVLGIAGLIAGYVYISREIPTFDTVRDYKPFVA